MNSIAKKNVATNSNSYKYKGNILVDNVANPFKQEKYDENSQKYYLKSQ